MQNLNLRVLFGAQNIVGKSGRKPGARLLADMDRAKGMRPATGPGSRQENAQQSATRAHQIAAIFNEHFTEPDWQVLVALVGTYVAYADGAQRGPATAAEGWTPLGSTRAYMPALAPPPSHAMMQCILPARLFGRAARDGRMKSAETSFHSTQCPDRRLIGLANGRVATATVAGTREMEGSLFFLMGVRHCWLNDIPEGISRMPDGSLSNGAAIAALGKLVGACPAAEEVSLSFLGYCILRHEAGAPMTTPHLRLCAGPTCTTPLFLWSRPVELKRIGNPAAPNYCPTCLGNGLGDEKSQRAKALREQRRRRRKNSSERGA